MALYFVTVAVSLPCLLLYSYFLTLRRRNEHCRFQRCNEKNEILKSDARVNEEASSTYKLVLLNILHWVFFFLWSTFNLYSVCINTKKTVLTNSMMYWLPLLCNGRVHHSVWVKPRHQELECCEKGLVGEGWWVENEWPKEHLLNSPTS